MTDLLSETLLFLGQASRRFPRDERGRAPSTTTLWRWRTKGIRGVRLEAARVGGRVVTSLEAIRRFLERLSGPAQTLVTISSGRLARGLWSRPTVAIDLASIPDPANVHLFAFVSITSGGRFSVIAGGCEDAMHVFGLLACNPRRGAVRCRFFRPRPADIDVTPTTPHYEVASRPWSEGGYAWHVSKT